MTVGKRGRENTCAPLPQGNVRNARLPRAICSTGAAICSSLSLLAVEYSIQCRKNNQKMEGLYAIDTDLHIRLGVVGVIFQGFKSHPTNW